MADLQVQQIPAFKLEIIWAPQAGRLEVRWPEIDDVAKLGMLEMAKLVLAEGRAKANMNNQSGIVIPNVRLNS